MLKLFISTISIMLIFEMVTCASMESLRINGSPKKGYSVRLGLGTPTKVVSIFVTIILLILINKTTV